MDILESVEGCDGNVADENMVEAGLETLLCLDNRRRVSPEATAAGVLTGI